jgi:hypothetical protein
VQLGAYQHHAFLDWRLVVGDEQWQAVHNALNGAGVPSVQGKWEQMFGVKEEMKEEKVKQLAKKRATKKAGKQKVTKSTDKKTSKR